MIEFYSIKKGNKRVGFESLKIIHLCRTSTIFCRYKWFFIFLFTTTRQIDRLSYLNPICSCRRIRHGQFLPKVIFPWLPLQLSPWMATFVILFLSHHSSKCCLWVPSWSSSRWWPSPGHNTVDARIFPIYICPIHDRRLLLTSLLVRTVLYTDLQISDTIIFLSHCSTNLATGILKSVGTLENYR